jgi:hypothetical protein
MVDRHERNDLADCLHRLVSGEITNDEFDSRYHRCWHSSEDGAVAEIATFGWGLYSDLHPYELKGPYAVSREIRETARHAILFLQTDLEYRWPRNVKGVVRYWGLGGPGFKALVGAILVFVGIAEGGFKGLLFGIIGLVAVVPTFHWLFTHEARAEELTTFRRAGDFQVWPFLSASEHEEAQRHCRERA